MKILSILLFTGILFMLYVRYLENTSLFYPAKEIIRTPEEFGLVYEDVFFETKPGVKLHGWFLPAKNSQATLLFLHGNAGNISDRIGKIAYFHQIGLNVLIIDYRGYGKSQGRPTEQGMYKDAVSAYDYLTNHKGVDSNKIIIYGASLGGAAAVDLAVKRKALGLIVDSTFTNAVDMAKKIYPFIPSFMITIKLDSLSKIQMIETPKLFIHSVNDELVPFELGKKLFTAAPAPKEFLEIDGTHNEGQIYEGSEFVTAVEKFVKGIL